MKTTPEMTPKKTVDIERQKDARKSEWKWMDEFTITGQDGEPYLERLTIVGTPLFSIMRHRFLRSDADRCLHDHPFAFATYIRSGGYWEEEHDPKRGRALNFRAPGSLLFRRAEHRHRVLLPDRNGGVSTRREDDVPAVTYVLKGPRTREWGFWTRNGWMPWQRFLSQKNEGQDQC